MFLCFYKCARLDNHKLTVGCNFKITNKLCYERTMNAEDDLRVSLYLVTTLCLQICSLWITFCLIGFNLLVTVPVPT
jgi:hypothetical protein